MGRTWNGHTALMAGKDGVVDTIVGWDPNSSWDAFKGSAFGRHYQMAPITGCWRDDTGMNADPTTQYYGLQIDQAEYTRFRRFLREELRGTQGFGSHLANSGVSFRYAFAPGKWMASESSLEGKAKGGDLKIISNCADAAFHVFASFLYEWDQKNLITEMASFINAGDEKNRNLSQGRLMRWLSQMEQQN
ncbi:hypothetical protein ACJJIF_04965 [Microbulbifer sp. SSSA002]|uniref:hypothetical protein n=1 Tax=Microbulbifer sp. SSSA002 TaxID=3243376 RepID=UPI00403A1FA1